MLYGQWIIGNEELENALCVRDEVFAKEQGGLAEIDTDEFDKDASHIIVFDEEKPVATGRVYLAGEQYKIGSICVLKDYRSTGIGTLVFRSLLGKALGDGAREVFLSAQEQAKSFYEKFGFMATGDAYPIDIGGRECMYIDMSVTQENVVAPSECSGGCSGCGGCG